MKYEELKDNLVVDKGWITVGKFRSMMLFFSLFYVVLGFGLVILTLTILPPQFLILSIGLLVVLYLCLMSLCAESKTTMKVMIVLSKLWLLSFVAVGVELYVLHLYHFM